MQSLDLDQLRTFLAVLDAGSLTAAAPRVFLSQSAVSEQMRKLEECVGQGLLARSKAGVLPTAAGDRLRMHAQRLVALADEALRDLRGRSLQGELRLAVTDYFRPRELARLLARLAQGHPRMRLNVTIKKSTEVEAMHARGETDIGLSMRVAESKSAAAVLRRESLAWMASPGWQSQPRGEPLPLLVLTDGCSLRQFTEQLLQKRRVDYRVAHVASGVAGLQSALAAGLGVACLNESALADGVGLLPAPHGLPALPRVDFHLLPPRRGEADLVTRVRDLLAQELRY
ncbi:MAG: LysR family transcriptional regulator [Proteobacteria bacterium]|nr:LysR family transcriptional regulator [Pseudomonadota bacterium]